MVRCSIHRRRIRIAARFLFFLVLVVSTLVATTYAALSSTAVVPSSLVAGSSSDVGVSFTSDVEIAIDSDIMVEFPSGFEVDPSTTSVSVDNAVYATTLTISTGESTATRLQCTVATAAIPAATAFTFTVSPVINPASGDSGVFILSVLDSTGATLDQDASIAAVTIVSAVFTSVSITPDSLDAGVAGTITVAFTSAVGLPVVSIIVVTLPTEFTIASSSTLTVASNLDASSSTVAMDPSGSQIKVTVAGTAVSAGVDVSFQVDGVANPGAVTTGAFALATTDSFGREYQSSTSITAVTLVSTQLSSAALALDTNAAGVGAVITIDVASRVDVKSGGQFEITFPVEYTVHPGVTLAEANGGITVSAAAITGQVGVFTVGTAVVAGTYSLVINGLRNPGVTTTGDFTLITKDSAGRDLEYATIPGVSTVAGTLASARFIPSNAHPGISSNVELSFVTSAALVDDTLIYMTLPTDDYSFAVANPSVQIVAPAGAMATVTWDSPNPAFAVLLSPTATIPGGSTIDLTITAFNTPPSIRDQATTANIQTWNSAGLLLDGPSQLTLDAITPMADLPVVWTTVFATPGITSPVVLAFDVNGAIPAGGSIVLALPASDFTVVSVPALDITTVDSRIVGATATWDLATNQLVIQLPTVGLPAYSTGLQLRIAAFDTPSSIRAAVRGPALLSTFDSTGAKIDGPSTITLDEIKPGRILGTRMWTSSQPHAGVTSDQTISFLTTGMLPVGAQIEFTLPDTGWGIAGAATVANFTEPALGEIATVSWDASTLLVTLTLTGAWLPAYSTLTFTVRDLQNPPKETGVTTVSAVTRSSDGAIVDGPSDVLINPITRGAFSGAKTLVSTTSKSASMESSLLFSISLSGVLPTGSILVLGFPSGGWRSQAAKPSVSIVLPATGVTIDSSTVEWSESAGLLTFKTSGALAEGAAVQVQIDGMINPFDVDAAAAGGHLSVKSALADGGVVDESVDVAINAIVADGLPMNGTWASEVATPGVVSTQTIQLTTGGKLEVGATLDIVLPVDYGWDVLWTAKAYAMITASNTQSELGLQWFQVASTLSLTFTVAIPQQTALEIVITNIRSPPSERPQATASLSILSHLGGLVNTGFIDVNSLLRGQLAGERLWQSALYSPGPVASHSTTATLTFTSIGQIPIGGTIILELPVEWQMDARLCSCQFLKPSVVGITVCSQNLLRITMSDPINEFTDVKVAVKGVVNPPTVLPAGVATMQTIAADSGVIDESSTVTTGAIESALLDITSSGDTRVAVVGVSKSFLFQGFSIGEGDVVKFVDASTTSDDNCGSATTGVSDVGGLDIAEIGVDHTVDLRSMQASKAASAFLLCYKFGTNPFKLYRDLSFTVKEITALTVDAGDVDIAVADYLKTWAFQGQGIQANDLVRWIDASVVDDAASQGSPPDCQDTSTLAKLVTPDGATLGANEDEFTRAMGSGSAVPFAFSPDVETAGKALYLCYQFGNEPFRIYTNIKITVHHVRSIAAADWGDDDVAVVDSFKPFSVLGEGVYLNDRLYFIEVGSATTCAPSSEDPALQLPHTIDELTQSVLFISADARTDLNFAAQAAGKKAMLCYQFGNEPFHLYAGIQLDIKMITLFTGARGSPRLAVAGVPEPLKFVGYGLTGGDQVRWIHSAEEACDIHLATLLEPGTLDPIDTITVDIGFSASFNFSEVQSDYDPVLCYRFGNEKFKLYSNLDIKIGTLSAKSATIGTKQVAVAEARKIFKLYGTHLAESDRVSWTKDPQDLGCVNASLLVPTSNDPNSRDTNYVSFTTLRSEFGVAFAARHSGDRVYLCYGFGTEPFKLYRDLFLDVKSVRNMRTLRGASSVAVAGAIKTLLFEGDGVDTGDFAKFVPASEVKDCSMPGVPVTNLQKEFDDAGEMAMYLYRNVPGITVGSFQFSGTKDATASAPGRGRVLCYRFGSEAFFYYDGFTIDIKTIWQLRHADAKRAGQPNVAVVDELKLIAIDGVGVSATDRVKWIETDAARTDQDCEDQPAQGLFARTISVFANESMWFPFEYESESKPWVLCYKFDDEPFRLFHSISVTVKAITDLRDAAFANSTILGEVAVVNQPKTWQPLGSGILPGDRVKFVPISVGSSEDCGLSAANTAGGSTLMTITDRGLFTGAFSTFPAALADQYRVCYQFQDEPFTYVKGLQLATYGIVALSRETFLASATTPLQLNGFRLANTDRLGWTSGPDCASVFNVVSVTDVQATILFDAAYSSLSLCYSFDRQPFTLFKSFTISVVTADIWIPQAVAVVAGQSIEIQVAGTFGLTVSSDQVAWVPSDALACSSETMAQYTTMMESSVVSTFASTTPIARSGSATISVTFSPPQAATLRDSMATWKLCYKFGNVPDFIMFGDVLCDVLTVQKIDLVESTPTSTGTRMSFQFHGVGIQEFDQAKWIDASSSTTTLTDAMCQSQPAVSGSVATAVISSAATFEFSEQIAAMALCYNFLRESSYKLFLNVPVIDVTATKAVASMDGDPSGASSSSSPVFVPNRDVATITLKLDKDINDVPAGSPAEAAFQAAFASALAASLGIDTSRIQIQELLAGSIIVKFQLLPSENVADPLVHELVQDLQTQLLDDTSPLRTNGGVLAIADPSSALTTLIARGQAVISNLLSTSSIAVRAYQANGLFTFTTDAVSVTEKTSRVLVRVLRQQGTNAVVTLPFCIAPGATATYGVDYRINSPSSEDLSAMFLRFDIGDNSQLIEIEVLDDAIKEAHFELFTLVLGDPGAPHSALGAFPQTTVRIFDWDDGVVVAQASFPAQQDRKFNLLGWRVVNNGPQPSGALRVDSNGLFAIDQVVGDDEYDQKCDLAAPSGACSFTCELGGSLADVAATFRVLHLHGDPGSYVATVKPIAAFPTSMFTLSFWIRTTAKSTTACVVSYAAPLHNGRVHLAVCNPTNLQLMMDTQVPTLTNPQPVRVHGALSTFIDVADGAWHFVAFTWNADDGRVHVYDNGLLAFDGGPYRVGHALPSDGVLVVGQLLDPVGACVAMECDVVPGRSLDAELQHVHLWTRELGRSELLKELQWPHRVVTNGLLLGWDFDSLASGGKVVADLSTRGVQQKNTGELVCTGDTQPCVRVGVLPTLSPGFPCGPVYVHIWHFVASPMVLQTLATSYGGRLQFRLLAPSRNGAARPRRGQISIFSGSSDHVSLALGGFPLPTASGWTYYSAVLREDFGWVREPSGESVATDAFQAVLSSATALWIRGDLWGPDTSAQGQEVVYLNDVKVFAR